MIVPCFSSVCVRSTLYTKDTVDSGMELRNSCTLSRHSISPAARCTYVITPPDPSRSTCSHMVVLVQGERQDATMCAQRWFAQNVYIQSDAQQIVKLWEGGSYARSGVASILHHEVKKLSGVYSFFPIELCFFLNTKKCAGTIWLSRAAAP